MLLDEVVVGNFKTYTALFIELNKLDAQIPV
jgi:hypothetical protein